MHLFYFFALAPQRGVDDRTLLTSTKKKKGAQKLTFFSKNGKLMVSKASDA